MENKERTPSLETVAVHGGEPHEGHEGSIVFPIYQGTIYRSDPSQGYHDLRYIRLNSTPSQRYLHDKLAALEGAEAALATASGMAALTTTLTALLKPGDHLLATDCLYGGTHDFLTQHAEGMGWRYALVDGLKPEAWAAARRPETKVFLTETIANPVMRVPRLAEIAAFGKTHGILTVIDNTFASPVNFRPLAHGFDLVFHSATKYLNGHSDIVAGAVMGRAELVEGTRKTLNLFGGSLDPHAGFLLARGIKTLALRMRAHNATGLALAQHLARHPKVRAVNHPGLPSHPDHAHASAVLAGYGGMLSFTLKDGVAAADRLLAALRIPYVAPSLGSVESLITRPALTSHAGMKREDRERMGISDDLVRVSCGIEAAEDLIADFDQALGAA